MIYTEKSRKEMAHRLKALREERGLSHKTLSDDLKKRYGKGAKGTSVATLKGLEVDYESDLRFDKGYGTRIDTMCLLADFYGVSVAYLLGETDIKSPDVNLKAAAEYTGLSEKALKELHEPPVNTVFTDEKFNPLTSKNGAVTWRPEDIERMLEPIAVRTTVLNEILEKNPAVLDQIAWFIYVKEFPTVKEPPTYEVDGRTYYAEVSSHILVNGYLENIKDEVRFLRERIEEAERKGKDGK